jgi:hypothetical protein
VSESVFWFLDQSHILVGPVHIYSGSWLTFSVFIMGPTSGYGTVQYCTIYCFAGHCIGADGALLLC